MKTKLERELTSTSSPIERATELTAQLAGTKVALNGFYWIIAGFRAEGYAVKADLQRTDGTPAGSVPVAKISTALRPSARKSTPKAAGKRH